MAFRIHLMVACLALLGLAACSKGSDGVELPSADRNPGISTFVSADGPGSNGGPPGGRAPGVGAEDGAGEWNGDGDDKTVEEGDIYRVLEGGKLLNFNSYRGLQVIDVSNPSAPSIVGRLPVWGTPVELYVSGTVAHLLLNGSQSYHGGRGDVAVEPSYSGLLISVDLTDPSSPREIARQPIAGTIMTSRLSRSSTGDILYVATGWWDGSRGNGGAQAAVSSFAVSQRGIAAIDKVELYGWIADIAATPRALLVARTTADWQRSTVALIDITRPDGTMVQGAEVEVAGRVASQFNMDLKGKVLRVVSNDVRRRTNVLETFDVTDFGAPVPVSSARFGDGEDLYATLFLDDSAFFVTYFRVDPFHAFSIDENGVAEEQSEFIVSGWNDFFRAVSGETRLIGIGVDDQRGRQMAVSLYDITDLGNPEPMIARAHVDSEWSHSEANWDHRAFSVIEGAVDVATADGARETGLVLLPFSGWSADGTMSAAVQIFTFSDRTLTRRGIMDHGSHVRRSFQVPAATATLSDDELALFDISTPDAPVEFGRLELAPNHTDALIFGDHLVRKVDGVTDYGYGRGYAPSRPTRIEVVSRRGDPSTNRALAALEIPYGSQLRKVGRHLLAVVGESKVQVFDLQNPVAPRARGEVSIAQTGSGKGGGTDRRAMVADCGWEADCGGWGGGRWPDDSLLVAGDALVFVTHSTETTMEGSQTTCRSWPANDDVSCVGEPGGRTCTVHQGYRTCTTTDRHTTCEGAFLTCTASERNPEWVCVETPDIPVVEHCSEQISFSTRQVARIHTVDLRNPDAPALGAAWLLPDDEDFVGVLADGDRVWVSSKKSEPTRDGMPWARFFTRRLDMSTPVWFDVGPAINVPGELFAVEGTTLFTKDHVWSGSRLDGGVARLRLERGHAVLEAHRLFPGTAIAEVFRDGGGHLVVNRSRVYGPYETRHEGAQQTLSILDEGVRLSILSEIEIPQWSSLRGAASARAFLQVSEGLLIYNLDDGSRPWAQAFFPTYGWPTKLVVEGREALLPAGKYGIHRVGLDEVNLPHPRR